MLGSSSMYADECRAEGYIGIFFEIAIDLSELLELDWKDFNNKFVKMLKENFPDKSNMSAGLTSGFIYTMCKSLMIGDTVISPDGKGNYYIGEITSDYYYVPGTPLCHRRSVKWRDVTFARSDMSSALRSSTGSGGTCCDVSTYAEEIEALASGQKVLSHAAKEWNGEKVKLDGPHSSEQNYQVNQYLVSNLLSMVQMGEIAIPEIQRPFVWEPDKVTRLIDSLYSGFPVGYIITWQGPNIKLKDGTQSAGKKIIIDGQQRITALRAAILGETVKNRDYRDVRIKVAYNPVENKFSTCNAAIEKNDLWIKDIAPLLNGSVKASAMRKEYCRLNPQFEEDDIEEIIDSLKDITSKQIGVIELSGNLDIEKVTEIFIRINSAGVPLNQADFVMSTIAANETLGGNMLRKCIDHFSELAVKPEFYSTLVENDREFAASPYMQRIAWLRSEKDDLYDPTYVDILRVAFTSKFNRGKMSDLVSLLSGRNFETRQFEQGIKENTYRTLTAGVDAFISETNFKRFIMIIRSAGFCVSRLIRSQNALNFAYILYLKLKEQNYKPEDIEKYVRRWFVYTLLKGRYSSSTESNMDYDVKQAVEGHDFGQYLSQVEAAEMSDAYWDYGIMKQLDTSVASNPIFSVFLASQCYQNRKGFLSKAITVKDMIEQRGDIHHIFPREYLKSNGMAQSQYNQVANFVYLQTEINIQIGKKSPAEYLGYIRDVQCNGGETRYGGITDYSDILANLTEECCLPAELADMTVDDYPRFLEMRRALMAKRLKEYYFSL